MIRRETATQHARIDRERDSAVDGPFQRVWASELVGISAAMRELAHTIQRIAATDVTVLIEGETGAGKELVAEAIHARSTRASGPYVVCDWVRSVRV